METGLIFGYFSGKKLYFVETKVYLKHGLGSAFA